jgi:hypothetical protein
MEYMVLVKLGALVGCAAGALIMKRIYDNRYLAHLRALAKPHIEEPRRNPGLNSAEMERMHKEAVSLLIDYKDLYSAETKEEKQVNYMCGYVKLCRFFQKHRSLIGQVQT